MSSAIHTRAARANRIGSLLAIVAMLGCEDPPPPPAPPPPPPPRVALRAAPRAGDPEVIGIERHLGRPGEESRARPTLIVLHGLGDTPEGFASMFEDFHMEARLISLRGLEPHERGFSWFPMHAREGQGTFSFAEGVRHATHAIVPWLELAARAPEGCGKPVVLGFSQGAMLTYAIAAEYPSLIHEAIPISGLLAEGITPSHTPGPRPRVIAYHGDADQLVESAEAGDAIEMLQAAGYDATLHLKPGIGHTVSAQMRTEIEAELRRALSSACPQ